MIATTIGVGVLVIQAIVGGSAVRLPQRSEVTRTWEDHSASSDLAAAPCQVPSSCWVAGRTPGIEAWPWLEAERQLVRRCVRANVVLGICRCPVDRRDFRRARERR